jgi:hypothetical protein
VVVLVACLLATVGCTTTHQLGRASDPATIAALEDAVVQPGAYVHVDPLPAAHSAPPGYLVHSVREGGVELDAPGPAAVVPFERLRYVSTYDRTHGARKGALIGGITGFVMTGVLTTLFVVAAENNLHSDGGTAPSQPVPLVIGASAIGGLVGSLFGAGVGAMIGHEDRYVVAGE